MNVVVYSLTRHVLRRPYTTVGTLKSTLLRNSNDWVPTTSSLHMFKPRLDEIDLFLEGSSRGQILQILSSEDGGKDFLMEKNSNPVLLEHYVSSILTDRVLYTKAMNKLLGNRPVQFINNQPIYINAVNKIFQNFTKLVNSDEQLNVNELHNLNVLCDMLIGFYQITKAREIIRFIFSHNSIFDVFSISNYLKLRSGADFKTWYRPFYQFTDSQTPISLLEKIQHTRLQSSRLLLDDVILSLGYFARKDLLLNVISQVWGISVHDANTIPNVNETIALDDKEKIPENENDLLYPTSNTLLNIFRSMVRLKENTADKTHTVILSKFLDKYPNIVLSANFWSDIFHTTVSKSLKDVKSDEDIVEVYSIYRKRYQSHKILPKLDIRIYYKLYFVLQRNKNLILIQSLLSDMLAQYAATGEVELKQCIEHYQKYIVKRLINKVNAPVDFDLYVEKYSINAENKLFLHKFKDTIISKRIVARKQKQMFKRKQKEIIMDEDDDGIIEKFW